MRPIRQRHRGEADDVQQNFLWKVTEGQPTSVAFFVRPALRLAREIGGGALHERPGRLPEGNRKVRVRLRRPSHGAPKPQNPVVGTDEDEVVRRRTRREARGAPVDQPGRPWQWRWHRVRRDDAESRDVFPPDPLSNRLHEIPLILIRLLEVVPNP